MHERHTSWWWAGARGAGVPRLAVPERTRTRAWDVATRVAALVLLALPGATQAQSLLERPPTMPGGWVGTPGTLQFNFLHRFTSADPPTRKVTSSPTLLVAAGLPWHALVGANYASNSDVAPRYPNEWEAFARWAPLGDGRNAPVDVGAQLGYNVAARSTDGELALGRRVGPLQLRAAARYLSNAFDAGDGRAALAAGGVLRLGRWVALAGDWATMPDRPTGYDDVWSAGVQLAIPYSPHTLSIHATNANTATLQGASAARADAERRWGFEFTVPLTLRRFVPRRAAPPPVIAQDTLPAAPALVETPAPASAAPVRADSVPVPADSSGTRPVPDSVRTPPPPPTTAIATAPRDTATTARAPATPRREPARPVARTVRTEIRQNAYASPRIVIPVGSTITWTNRDPMIHTVTSDDRSWDSGLIEPGGTYRRRFDRPGTYTFHCTPHPFMKGVVVVR